MDITVVVSIYSKMLHAISVGRWRIFHLCVELRLTNSTGVSLKMHGVYHQIITLKMIMLNICILMTRINPYM